MTCGTSLTPPLTEPAALMSPSETPAPSEARLYTESLGSILGCVPHLQDQVTRTTVTAQGTEGKNPQAWEVLAPPQARSPALLLPSSWPYTSRPRPSLPATPQPSPAYSATTASA